MIGKRRSYLQLYVLYVCTCIYQFTVVPPILPPCWNISQRSEGLAPKQVDNLKIYKVKPQTTQLNSKRKRRITEYILLNLYCPDKKPKPYKEFQQKLVEQLTDMKSDSQILKVLAGSDSAKLQLHNFVLFLLGLLFHINRKLCSQIVTLLLATLMK